MSTQSHKTAREVGPMGPAFFGYIPAWKQIITKKMEADVT